jgi:hypothetical protein
VGNKGDDSPLKKGILNISPRSQKILFHRGGTFAYWIELYLKIEMSKFLPTAGRQMSNQWQMTSCQNILPHMDFI